ncbi:MAG: thioredoxin family protein, partial [Phycisphaerales bacterium]|nr:thioredoxin family protein [Phycisphaerales bacterium]
MMRLNATSLRAVFDDALDYDAYLATDPERGAKWTLIHDAVALTAPQRTLVTGFVRNVKILVSSGIWCGDCVQQGPLLQRI